MHARFVYTSTYIALKLARSLQFVFVVLVILKPSAFPLPRSALPLSRGVAGAHLKLILFRRGRGQVDALPAGAPAFVL